MTARGVQYSDRPPPASVSEKDILARPSPTARPAQSTVAAPPTVPGATAALPVPAAAASSASAASAVASGVARSDPVLESRRRDAERAEAAKQKAEVDKLAVARADNCQRARAQLRTMEDGLRIARVNANGEREILDEKTRAAEAERARGVIVSDCR